MFMGAEAPTTTIIFFICYVSAVSILLEYLTEYMREYTRLLVMRPLSIGKQKCSFLNYEPPPE